ncbi:inactive CLIP domain-containing serine protease A3-like [Diabrotica undecimpunctata]|uniref:inactive CLIP domain-containing serine protease A3-like n=1 Tax=Diabrotica undecimpunctata TaxID=50387 RepID=UPI003B636974
MHLTAKSLIPNLNKTELREKYHESSFKSYTDVNVLYLVTSVLVPQDTGWETGKDSSPVRRITQVKACKYRESVCSNSIDLTYGQATSGMVNGQYYLCLPTGTTCPTSGTGTIDPRIITPVGAAVAATTTATATCPTGTTACFGTNTACGTRFVTANTTASGTATYGAFPWQAYLRNTTNAYAGSGVLISPYYVITAAHKVYLNVNTPTAVTVLMGVYNPTNLVNVQSSTVARIAVHPNFVATTLFNDIAVLQLTQPIVLGIYADINTACLPAAGTSFVGQACAVSGWGQTGFTVFDAPTNPQKQAFVTIVSYATCRASFAMANLLGTNVDTYLDPNGELCAGGVSMVDACTQDGGSPLVCPSTTGAHNIAGLVIWGKNCGQTGVYGVYVSVSNYTTWIQSQMTTPAG